MIEKATQKDIARFWSKVEKSDGCWRWMAGRTKNGYGVMGFGGRQKTVYGHRFSWELHNGPLPQGAHVLHRCDNPQCTNPRHLFVGTHADNMRDLREKGRHARGSRNGHARISEPEVIAMRRLRKEAGASYGLIASKFGISYSSARRACVGMDWAHVDGIEPPAPVTHGQPKSYSLTRRSLASTQQPTPL